MKRITAFRNILSSLLIGSFSLVSCTSQDPEGVSLLDGAFPFTCQATVDSHAATRSSYAGTFETTDEVGVSINGVVKNYMPNSSGVLFAKTGVTPFCWSSSAETKQVQAWYPYNNGVSPTSWSVQSDQHNNGGFQKSDFLYAPPINIPFSNQTSELKFYHQTARVDIQINYNGIITSVSEIASVTIGDASNLALKGNYAAPTSASQLVGTWSSNTTNMGTIKPCFTLIGANYSRYSALLIPQNMTGKKFIVVKLTNGKSLYYTPQGTDGNLQGGKNYSYNVTLKSTYLEVTTSTSTGWTNGGNTAVTGKEVAALYTATDVKPGDYFYRKTDGTWATSDGGLRVIYTDGTARREKVLPDVTKGTLVGVIFKKGRSTSGIYSDTETYRQKDGSTPMSTINGYVMGYSNADSSTWSFGIYSFVAGSGATPSIDRTFTGYSQTKNIKTYASAHSYDFSYYYSTYNASDYAESQTAAPTNSTGWFLPSMGQLECIMNYKTFLLDISRDAFGSTYNWKTDYWSCNEYSASQAYYLKTSTNEFLYYTKGSKASHVIPCLVF